MKFKGNNPILSILEAEQTARAIRAQAQAEERTSRRARARARNQRRKAQREATEARAEATPRAEAGAEAEARAETLYYIGNRYGVHRQTIATILENARSREAPEPEEAQSIKPISNKSFLMLYYSKRLFIGGKEASQLLRGAEPEDNEILQHLRHLNPTAKITEKVKIKTADLKEVVFNSNGAKSPTAQKYIAQFRKGRGEPTNPVKNELGGYKPVLSYRNIGYDYDRIIIIGKPATVKGIAEEYKRRETIKNGYYDFIESEENKGKRKHQTTSGEIRKTRRTRARNKKHAQAMFNYYTRNGKRPLFKLKHPGNRYLTIAEALKVAMKNKGINQVVEAMKVFNRITEIMEACKTHIYYTAETEAVRLKTEVQGLNGLTETEKEAIKRAETRGSHRETAEEVQELFRIAKATDGRQKIKNIEYDIRAETKYLRSYGATELYYIFSEVEEQADKTKKETALLNVIGGYKDTAEAREDRERGLKESITETEAEADNRQTVFKANKKGKSIYSTKAGITARNRSPTAQEYKFRRNNPQLKGLSSETIKEMIENTEAEKKAKLNTLKSIQSIREAEEEAEARARAEAETDPEARARAEAEAQAIARRHNRREQRKPSPENQALTALRNQEHLLWLQTTNSQYLRRHRQAVKRLMIKEQIARSQQAFIESLNTSQIKALIENPERAGFITADRL